MLRISIIESDENTSTVKLEGHLTGAWTEEFKATCERVFATGRSLSLDVWDVTLIDRPALDFLVSLASHAATQVHCSPFREEQLKQAAAKSQGSETRKMNPSEPTVTASPTNTSHVCPERWVDEHGDCLYRYALMRVRKPEIAEDLVQETFLAALRAQDNVGVLSSERNWLFGILKNKICDRFRKLGRETNFTDLEFLSDDHAQPFDGEHGWVHGCGPREWKPEGEAAMNRKEFWQAFYDCIDRLPERLAQVFTMREMEDLPSKEICATLNISEANLWVVLHRARMALREDLEKTFFKGKADLNL